MLEIKAEDYWLIKDGSTVCVLKKIEEKKDSPRWLVKKLYRNGEAINNFPVAEANFERKLSLQEARKAVEKFFKKRAKDFLNQLSM